MNEFNVTTMDWKEQILKSYCGHSEISKAVIFKKFDINIDKNIELSKIDCNYIIPKDCSTIWSSYGGHVALREINYFLEKILNNSSVEKSELVDVGSVAELYELIETAVYSLIDKGFNPSTILLPIDYFTKFKIDGFGNKSKITGYDEFKVNEYTTLDIILSSKYKKFETITILDRDTCIWTFEPADEDNNRLHVEMTEHKNDMQKVELTTKTLINLKIENTDAIKILSINAQF